MIQLPVISYNPLSATGTQSVYSTHGTNVQRHLRRKFSQGLLERYPNKDQTVDSSVCVASDGNFLILLSKSDHQADEPTFKQTRDSQRVSPDEEFTQGRWVA